MTVTNLSQLFEEELKDIYDAEKQLVKALPKMAKAASSPDLRKAFQAHLEVTKGHVKRIEQIFESMGKKAKSKSCNGMKGLIQEGSEIIQEKMDEPLMDTALIGGAQRVEHYEIAAYGTARALAEKLGNSEAADFLQQTLDEEKEADAELTEIAEMLLGEISNDETLSHKAGARTKTSRA
jgi:ferritin-like metal-binding protein YciE